MVDGSFHFGFLFIPSFFIGGPRDMRIRYVNAMTLVQQFGKPDLFLTMMCNPTVERDKLYVDGGRKPR